MLYILIPCLLLLVVAVILKKRESANSDTAQEKSTKKSSAKKAKTSNTRSSRPASTQSKATSAPVATETATDSLDPEVRSSIENLIKAENYSAAEAKINQALNQNNNHHELYLYLLDIHVAQKDEFAIKQLINYLRSLGLHDIADQAEAKQQRSTKVEPKPAPASSFQAAHASTHLANDQVLKSETAFDDLIQPEPAPAFDQLNSMSLATEPKEAADHQPLEYTFESKKPAEETPAVDLDFSAPESFKLDVETKKEPAPEVAPLEFNFSTPAVEEKSETTAPIEDFTFDEKPAVKEKVEAPAAELKLDAELPLLNDSNDFHFSLDTPLSADPNSVAFETQQIDLAPKTVEPEIDASELENADDPLAQSFPDLLKVNEIQLNLDLAERYIELGAYESAKKLIASDEASFSIEQRQRSQKLLNQIAS